MNKKSITVLAVVLVALVVGFFYLQPEGDKAVIEQEYVEFPVEIKTSADKNLDAETEEFLRERIAENKEFLSDEEITTPDRIARLVAIFSDYASLGDYDDALATIEGAVLIADDSQAVQKTYSEFLYEIGNYEKSILVADKAVQLDPWKHLPWLWRAELEEKLLVDPRGADIIYEQALVETERNEDIMIARAEFLERVGDNEAAIDAWREFQVTYPERGEVAQNRIDLITK